MNSWKKIVHEDRIMKLFFDGMTLMYGGFGGIGTPPTLVSLVTKNNNKDLTLIGNDAGFPTIGIGPLIVQRRVKKIITSHIGSNPVAGKQKEAGIVEVDLVPQGILAEKIRAGGVGIGGFLSDIGVEDPLINKDKRTLELNEKLYLLETSLVSDISIVYAKIADEFGNVIYEKSARNINPLVAMAGKITIVEAEQIVKAGELNPNDIHTSGVFVDYILQSKGVDWKWVWE